MTEFGMFTAEGNRLVGRIAAEARDLAAVDGPQQPAKMAMDWAYRELEALSQQPEFEEATDTAVREAVFDYMFLDN